jgi:Uma2 family endonuclease
MSTTAASLPGVDPEIEPRIVLGRITYALSETINNAIFDRHDPRMIYAEGRLVLLSTSRLHDWFAELLGQLFAAVATGCRVEWEPSGQATYRHPNLDAGVEGDRVYHVGAGADVMRGPCEIDLGTQPPPDLAIEVEHIHPAKEAMIAWGRIGVPEVWRFSVKTRSVSFWRRRDDCTYVSIDRSVVLPVLRPADVDDQLPLAESIGSTSRWHAQLNGSVRDNLLPRLGGQS